MNQLLETFRFQETSLILYALKAIRRIAEQLKKLFRNRPNSTDILDDIS